MKKVLAMLLVLLLLMGVIAPALAIAVGPIASVTVRGQHVSTDRNSPTAVTLDDSILVTMAEPVITNRNVGLELYRNDETMTGPFLVGSVVDIENRLLLPLRVAMQCRHNGDYWSANDNIITMVIHDVVPVAGRDNDLVKLAQYYLVLSEPLPFPDVAHNAAYHNAVRHMLDTGIMVGTSPTTFGPHTGLNRAQTSTILFRLSNGSVSTPDAGASLFSDVVPGNQWWARDYITWAADADIMHGIGGGRFNPGGSLTREQLAATLYRFAVSEGMDVSVPTHVTVPGASNWALEYMRWAVYNGFIGAENPRSPATRADTAMFVYRFDTR